MLQKIYSASPSLSPFPRKILPSRSHPYSSRRRSFTSAAGLECSVSDGNSSSSSVPSMLCSLESSDGKTNISAPSGKTQILRAYLRKCSEQLLSQVRGSGLIPAVLHDPSRTLRPSDGKSDVGLSLESKPVYTLLKKLGKRDFLSRVFHLEVFSMPPNSELKESLQVIPRNLNYGPGKTNIFNIQLLRAIPGRIMTLAVPLEFLGKEHCPGLRKGGVLKTINKFVLYNCQASELPAKIVVDTTVLEIGDRVLVQDLEVDFNLLHSDRQMPVCEIIKDAATLKARAKRKQIEHIFTNLAKKKSKECKLEPEVIMIHDDESEDEIEPASSITTRKSYSEGMKAAVIDEQNPPQKQRLRFFRKRGAKSFSSGEIIGRAKGAEGTAENKREKKSLKSLKLAGKFVPKKSKTLKTASNASTSKRTVRSKKSTFSQ